MSYIDPTWTQMQHLMKWVEAKAYPKNFDTSFIEAMELEGAGWTTAQEIAIENIYTKFRVASAAWVKKHLNE